ncbi:peptide-methionine (S)-S-oxide reductase MsrA [Patescibacteria group bacterium]
MNSKNKTKQAIFGGGCFWCLEPIFENIKGVSSVVPGYAGGTKENPTYEEVLSEKTGHAEVVRIEYNEAEIHYEKLVNFFFSIHDPTTLNRQGDDVGSQYRSIVMYQDESQKSVVNEIIRELEAEKVYGNKIVTEVVPFEKFYEAEEEHHHYYKKNPNKAYCRLVIFPKLKKFRAKYGEYLSDQVNEH